MLVAEELLVEMLAVALGLVCRLLVLRAWNCSPDCL
jgi:hypothetical protein